MSESGQSQQGRSQRRRVVTEVPGPLSRALAARRASALPAGLSSAFPMFVADAGPGYVVDVDGNSFLDLGSGIAVTGVGNSAPRVVSRAGEQLARFTHTCFMVNPYEGYVEVCEQLNRLTPGDHVKRSALFNSGAEAVENAVKYARSFTGRPAVIVFDHAFHGRTLMTMSMTAAASPYKRTFGPFAPEVYRAPMAYPYRWPSGPENAGREAFEQFTMIVEKQIGADSVAAVVVEPVQGEGGFIVPAPGFLRQVADYCAAHGILLIADEVQSGFGRTGDWFASEFEQIVPDLVTTAKGLGGGLPLAGVTGRAEIMDSVHAGGIGGTYSGNPVACAAALGVIESIEHDGLLARARSLGEIMIAELGEIAAESEVIGEIRGRGAMVAAELVTGPDRAPDPNAVAAVIRHARDHGVLLLGAGTYGNVLRLLPPMVMPEERLRDAMGVLREAFATL